MAGVIHTPESIIKEVELLAYNFLWNGKQHKVKKKVIVQDYEWGGCKMVDFETMNKIQKIKLIIKFFTSEESDWKLTMKAILGVDDLPLFLKSNFRIPVNTTLFYEDVLRFWKEVKYKDTTSSKDIKNQYLFYNQHITINKQVIYQKSLIEKGILQVGHIIRQNGSLKSFNEVCTEYDLNQSNFMIYSGIIKKHPISMETTA